MNIREAKKLKAGDRVNWNDPDDGACSRHGDLIEAITVKGDVVHIQWEDGGATECLARELEGPLLAVRVNACAKVSVSATVYAKKGATQEQLRKLADALDGDSWDIDDVWDASDIDFNTVERAK